MYYPMPRGFGEASLVPYHRFASRLTVLGTDGITQAMPGLEDVIGGSLLGDGLFHNTCGTVSQLCVALALSAHPTATEVIELDRCDDRDEVTSRVTQLRSEQVLNGMRILDLGCGIPYFAAAATALGAITYTADAEDFTRSFPGQAQRHLQLDLREAEAAERIVQTTGDQLDVVTEQIISPLPSQRHLSQPSRFIISDIARPLLRGGGILYALTFGLSQDGLERL